MDLRWTFSEKQDEADEAPEQFVLYGGAKGGGKSFWLVRWVVKKCMEFPGNKGFLGRKRGVDLNNTTLETFKKAVPPELYRINEQKKKIYFPTLGAIVDYGGLDDPGGVEKFNSAEYGFLAIDQAEEIDRHQFGMLRGTLRHKLPNGQEPDYQVRLTANPAQCWLKEDFILNPKPGHRFIKALPSDNPFLAKGYIENLRQGFEHRPDLLQAYLYGSWDELAGSDICIQASWVEKAKDLDVFGAVTKRVVACDPARFGDDETVIYVMEKSNVVNVIHTEILAHKSLMDTAGRLVAIRKKFDASVIALDAIGIGAGIYDSLNELGESVQSVVSSNKPTISTDAERYMNLRAQLWMVGGKQIFEGKVKIPDDTVLCGQLSSAKFEFNSNGKIKVEAKVDIKKRLNRSPDRADAFLIGLHAISDASSLDSDEYKEASTDRVGRGEPVKPDDEFDYCWREY